MTGIVPERLARDIEEWAASQHEDAARYDNSEVLDEGGVNSLHTLVANAYGQGWRDGERHSQIRYEGRYSRADDAARRATTEAAS